jgi:hypothetical protein
MVKANSSGTNPNLWAAYESKCSEENLAPERDCGIEAHLSYQMKDHCPRCLSPWETIKNGSHYCSSKCGMHLSLAHIYILENLIKEKDFLAWYVKENYCCYFPSVMALNQIKLPYLKFDISPSQLKLYLTFS